MHPPLVLLRSAAAPRPLALLRVQSAQRAAVSFLEGGWLKEGPWVCQLRQRLLYCICTSAFL